MKKERVSFEILENIISFKRKFRHKQDSNPDLCDDDAHNTNNVCLISLAFSHFHYQSLDDALQTDKRQVYMRRRKRGHGNIYVCELR